MPTITWDALGERFYELGVDRAVLYPPNGVGVPWNGLIGVTEKLSGAESSAIYFDGVKYADTSAPGDFSGTLKAYTYPDAFAELEGTYEIGNGLFATSQQPQRFGLTYRTKIGNDEDGSDHGYKIHILYNLLAIPSQKNYQSVSTGTEVVPFEWSLTAVPSEIPGFRSTAHLIFDTRHMSPELLADVEDALYGDGISAPTLPAPSTLASFIGGWVIIRITDNGDGTWTAVGPDNLISALSPTSFQINQANAKILDPDTYLISDLTY